MHAAGLQSKLNRLKNHACRVQFFCGMHHRTRLDVFSTTYPMTTIGPVCWDHAYECACIVRAAPIAAGQCETTCACKHNSIVDVVWHATPPADKTNSSNMYAAVTHRRHSSSSYLMGPISKDYALCCSSWRISGSSCLGEKRERFTTSPAA